MSPRMREVVVGRLALVAGATAAMALSLVFLTPAAGAQAALTAPTAWQAASVVGVTAVSCAQGGATAATADGRIVSSGDGIKWHEWASGFGSLRAIDSTDGNSLAPARACVVGDSGTIASLTATGWKASSSGTGETLNDVSCGWWGDAWAVGTAGTILHSSNGGATWKLQQSGVTSTLNAVYLWSDTQAWAVGDDGVILATSDGKTWHPQDSPVSVSLRDVVFVNAKLGWACGDGGTVVSTVDGGAHWLVRTVPLSGDATAISFVDARRGWVADDTGALVHTMDGGASWTAQDTGTGAPILAMEFFDRSVGFAVTDGAILSTSTGGWPDTTGPVTRAFRSAGRRGHLVWLYFSVTDEQCGWVHGVTLRIKKAGRTVKVLRFGGDGECAANIGGRFGRGLQCRLRPGWYRFYVYAIDASGNHQSVVGWSNLRVSP